MGKIIETDNWGHKTYAIIKNGKYIPFIEKHKKVIVNNVIHDVEWVHSVEDVPDHGHIYRADSFIPYIKTKVYNTIVRMKLSDLKEADIELIES